MNTIYKYSLDTTSKKFVCPNCNKKTFVKFIDNETNQYLNDIDGRCDRESKCGYFKKPDNKCITKSITNCITEVIQPTYHNKDLVLQYRDTLQKSNFIVYLLSVFDVKSVLQAIKTYNIGITNYWHEATIFWQIDTKNRIRGGKIMQYNCNTGKRVKQPFNHVSWVHKQLKLNNFVLQQCLFGLHNLTNISKDDIVCIIESEKTAIIMSILFPNYLWLATGSKTRFKQEMLQPLKEYNVIVYPDKTVWESWNKTAILLNKQGFHIQCSSLLENLDIEDGGDLVDFLI
ncbi:DUF6371 domain-containing protein [Polaribacter glomeratus]|uniref:Uncharacterized protein n=1 Tax=Polaribacter glomeratus TaxID=102 RepID=A0A2S7WZL7_9FLAO|nr:DUF6371 domain-containing protein [Polaribacter glomeratus]PQJ82938.1 hypothetical protein BTO16_02310 [Polaribacter glomeratus]TXD64696.1 hypothetical protein ESX12_14260 [Polaribacter glomeratus]